MSINGSAYLDQMSGLPLVFAGVDVIYQTQYPGWMALGRVVEGWFGNPALQNAAVIIALTAIYAKTMESVKSVQNSQKAVNQVSDGDYSSPRFASVTAELRLSVTKFGAIGVSALGVAYNFGEVLALLSTGGEDAIQKVFVHGKSLLSSQPTPTKVPWDHLKDLGFKFSHEEKEAVDTFLDKDAFYDTPPPPLNFWDDDEPIKGFSLTKDQME